MSDIVLLLTGQVSPRLTWRLIKSNDWSKESRPLQPQGGELIP